MRLSRRSPNRHCLFSSWAAAGLSPDSIDRVPRLVVRKQPVAARLLVDQELQLVCLASGAPDLVALHHSSNPNMVTDRMHAVTTSCSLPARGPSASEPAPPGQRVLPVLGLNGLVVLRHELGVVPGTGQRVASQLNGTVLSLNLTVAVGRVFFLQEGTASVFP